MADRLGTDRTNALLLVVAMIAVMWITEAIDLVRAPSASEQIAGTR